MRQQVIQVRLPSISSGARRWGRADLRRVGRSENSTDIIAQRRIQRQPQRQPLQQEPTFWWGSPGIDEYV
jgi:hypothetical protein